MTTDKGLMVWLPLNGTLENKGLVKSTITSSGVSWSNSGKIGKCFDNSDRGTRWILLLNAFPAHDTDHTVCFWVKSLPNIAVSNDWGYIYTTSNINATEAAKCIIDVSTTNGYNITDSCPTFTVTVNDRTQWNHITIVTTKTKVVAYVNGLYSNELTRNATIASSATRHIAISRNSTGPGTSWNMRGSINDFRVYSYALSPQEIKELSKGKIGHWLCDGNGTALPNLITGNYSIFKTSTRETETGTISSIPATTILANKGKTLCFSMRKYSKGARTDGTSGNLGARFGIHWSCKYTRSGKTSQYDYPMASFLTDASDGIVYCTWTIPSDLVSVESDLSPAIQTHGSSYARPTDAGVIWYITDVKLEWGTMPSLYSTSNQAFLSDISGNHYDLDINGNVILDASTPRYNKSIKLIGNDTSSTSYLHRPYFDFLQQVTMSCWVKLVGRSTVQGTGTTLSMHIMGQGRDYENFGFVICSDIGVPCLKCGAGKKNASGGVASSGYNISSGVTMALDTWYHIAATYDGTNAKIYVDGVLKATQAVPSPLPWHQCSKRFVIGKMAYGYSNTDRYSAFDGNISDARVYATALSADDVKELYSLGH